MRTLTSVTKHALLLAAGLSVVGAAPADAMPRRGPVVVVRPLVVARPVFHDPFWGPWYPEPYVYTYTSGPRASVKTDVSPKGAQVYVDGYYAGEVRDFDGAFKHLDVVPGGHRITLYLDGFRTTTQNVYVRPDSTFTLRATMDRLASGEASAPVPRPERRAADRGPART